MDSNALIEEESVEPPKKAIKREMAESVKIEECQDEIGYEDQPEEWTAQVIVKQEPSICLP